VRDGEMVLVLIGPDLQTRDGLVATLKPGESVLAGANRITFTRALSIPAIQVFDMPGAESSAGATVQMPTAPDGTPYLYVSGVDSNNLTLGKDRPVRSDSGLTYTFRGQVEASGVSIKRDPGDTFIWIAVGMAIVGLAITFYVPRRRLWVRITGTRTAMAGVAEKTTRLGREMRLMGAELGARDALTEADLQREV
jgi:cytochrome c biogenesis protein ResB